MNIHSPFPTFCQCKLVVAGKRDIQTLCKKGVFCANTYTPLFEYARI